MEEACQAVQDRISSVGGSFNFQMKPKVVTATDEADLAKQLERAEQENAEVYAIPFRFLMKSLTNCQNIFITVGIIILLHFIIRLVETKIVKKKLVWEDLPN